ncbi:hypothetical protein Tsubulata_003032 [Turnera subulata]|uniref:HMG box domain-containing protein n=1 Tax=Turnera subulata TaxID=218843 RepID=A0A9Q0G4J0_9ROSI|nr:hypothetical protein Tsubulata_003032 [Turnera subulata]
MASTSCVKRSPVPMKEPVMNYIPYPTPVATYEEVVDHPGKFITTLEKFHADMGTKFMVPIIGGKGLDLHRLFVEVTSRGGIEKIIREKRWKEVTAIFNFPSTATNASFVLRKYYCSLLQHFEQLYYFKARGWAPAAAAPFHGLMTAQGPAQVPVQPSPEYQAATVQQQRINTAEQSGARPASSASSPVVGVIDGKFESGYLVTVTIGSEKLKGVLYQAPQSQPCIVQPHYSASSNSGVHIRPATGTQRRRRRKKNEIKRRDPAHPKPNRSGYNFFFAEQHARLKPLHPGKDREISRMIGELWNKLNDSEKTVYQEKALKDKERYRIEMENYRERLRTGRMPSEAVPIQQWLPGKDTDMVEVDVKAEETEGVDSPHTQDNDSSSDENESEDDKTGDKGLDMEASPGAGLSADSGNMEVETSPGSAAFQPFNSEENAGNQKVGDSNMENAEAETQENTVPGEGY